MTYIEPESGQSEDDDVSADQREDIRELRKAANRANEIRSENEQLKRQLALARKGVDPESIHGKVLLGYDGELTDELITELTGQPVVEEPPASALSDIRRDLAVGAEEPREPKVNTRAEARQIFDDAVANGTSREEAGGMMFRRLVQGAMEGDEDVIIKVF